MTKIDKAEIAALAESSMPWVGMLGFTVEALGRGTCRVRLPQNDEFLRPGGTVSGPALMALADYAMYVAVLSAIGRVELAVTTNLTCNFLRKAPPGAVIAECRLLKLGKRLAYGEATLFAEGDEGPEGSEGAEVGEGPGPVAHVTATYSIPPPASDAATP